MPERRPPAPFHQGAAPMEAAVPVNLKAMKLSSRLQGHWSGPSAISKHTTDPSGRWSRNEEERVRLLNRDQRQTFPGMSDSPLCRPELRSFAPAIGVAR